jgi:DNA-binding NarL/FixJ family response regulator
VVRNEGSVLVADGDVRERRLVAGVLRRAGYETVEVENGFDALEVARAGGVGLLILEVALPGMTGYEVCHELRRESGNQLPIVLVSATRTDSLDRVAGLLLGADDYIAKPLESAEVLARIRRLLARRADAYAPSEGEGEILNHLTHREREVLDLLAQGLAQQEIARYLSISPKTVGTHLQTLMSKLGVHSRAELVARAYRAGLVSEIQGRREAARTPNGPRPV